MTKVSALPVDEISERLRRGTLVLKTGPFRVRLRSPLSLVAANVHLLYADNPLLNKDEFADFEVSIAQGQGLHRWIRRQARFVFDGLDPFEPMPEGHAHPLLEWAMNWCVTSHAHQYLLLHSAVIERDDRAVILPAPPGSGKSTLCAGLIHRGWRLLSDELALINPSSLQLVPLVRPISLKNQSIGVIRQFVPDATMSQPTMDTSKGTVAHLKAPAEHVLRADEPAEPRWVIFPRFVAGSSPKLTPRAKSDGMHELSRNSFNYGLLGKVGFETLADVVEKCDLYDFEYGNLDDAVSVFCDLAASTR